jgi:hypothetical protein
VALGLTHPVTEMSTGKSFLVGKAWPVRKTDNLTATCDPLVLKMWDPRHLSTQQVTMAYYRDNFAFLFNRRKVIVGVFRRNLSFPHPFFLKLLFHYSA